MEDSWTIGGVAFSQKLDSHGNGTVTATAGKDEKILSTKADVVNTERAAAKHNVSADDVESRKQKTKASLNVVDRLENEVAAITVPSEEGGGTQESSFLAENIDAMAVTTGMAALGTGAVLAVDKYSKVVQPKTIPMTEQDLKKSGYTMNENGTATGRNGNVVTPRDGKFYDEHNTPMTKDNPKWKDGVVRRAWDANTDKLKSATDKLRGIDNETFDDTPNSGDEHQESKESKTGTDNPNNKVEHNKSFNQNTESKTSPSEKSIPKTDKSSKAYDDGGKATSVSEQINQTTTSNRR